MVATSIGWPSRIENNAQVCRYDHLDFIDKRCVVNVNLPEYWNQKTSGVEIMVTTTSNGKIKKTSRGMRRHVRRQKQESRKMGVPINELKKKVRTVQKPKVKKEA